MPIVLLAVVVVICIAVIGAVLHGGGGSGSAGGINDGYPSGVHEVLRVGRQRMDRIGRLSHSFGNAEMSDRVAKIGQLADDILKTLEKRPDKVSDVRFFLEYYLPALVKLSEDYIDADQAGDGPNGADARAREGIYELMGDIEAVFARQLDALTHGAAIDIEAEIREFSVLMGEDGPAGGNSAGGGGGGDVKIDGGSGSGDGGDVIIDGGNGRGGDAMMDGGSGSGSNDAMTDSGSNSGGGGGDE
ncbi:MAG: 5-bromo-4-chloroindolyl phosphate hydrolysis family protein [Oscillospiraceae bacterium]|nr:5-bromo-4-chloroindolyl phosphate hydrolysis family protein [Oscillospiraceae bacterium]